MFVELLKEICQFITTELRNKRFWCLFLCDITSHLNALNLQLQVRDHVITDMRAAVEAIKTKLCLWEMQTWLISRAANYERSDLCFQVHNLLKSLAC